MKKLLIGALVGGLILFIWQFLSFGLLNLHGSQMAYTPQQDAILEALAAANLEEGQYFVPSAPKGTSQADQQKLMEPREGKPWAQVFYHKSLKMGMGMNMIRGFVIDFLAALLLCWILMRFASLDLKTAVMASVAIGLMGYLTISYLNSVWFETNSIPDLIDGIVPWAAIGAWSGWWLTREAKTA